MKWCIKPAIWLFTLVAILLLQTDFVFAQSANKTTAQGLIVTFSRFLTNIIFPFLVSVAFLYFIYNVAKFFIFKGAEDKARADGKRNAIWGIAAFVFIVSIWAIVDLFISGFNLTRDRSLCADYFALFGAPCQEQSGGSFTGGGINSGSGSGIGGGQGTGTGGTGTGNGGTGGGSSTGGSTSGSGSGTGGTGTGSVPGNAAPLAELIFGTGKDSAGFATNAATSSALSSTPIVPATATCVDGLTTLKLSSNTETTQAAYLYYKTSAGAKRWKNVTDTTSSNHIGYDADVIKSLIANGATNLYVVHTHPKARAVGLGLSTTGHGPSAADMSAVCTLNNASIGYVTVDMGGVWLTTHTAKACPFGAENAAKLPIIETYGDLGALTGSSRASQLAAYVASSLTPTTYKTYFGAIPTTNLSTYTTAQILALSQAEQTVAGVTITYRAIDAFCATR